MEIRVLFPIHKHRAFLALLFVCFLMPTAALAQRVSFGAKGGFFFTNPTLEYSTDKESRAYLVGPSIEFRLPANFAAEIDALYQRTGYSVFIPNPTPSGSWNPGPYVDRFRGNSVRFPVLGKYYFGAKERGCRPFVGTGYLFETAWMHEDFSAATGHRISDFRLPRRHGRSRCRRVAP
jgi:hypothetical protein